MYDFKTHQYIQIVPASLSPGLIVLMMNRFCFQGMKKAFRDDVFRSSFNFREMLEGLNQEFEIHLTKRCTVRTAKKHSYKLSCLLIFYAGIPT